MSPETQKAYVTAMYAEASKTGDWRQVDDFELHSQGLPMTSGDRLPTQL